MKTIVKSDCNKKWRAVTINYYSHTINNNRIRLTDSFQYFLFNHRKEETMTVD